ncbi:uncharacterized protein LOC114580657 [Dendrobium catenatum]|uniref:uncharacterized protein LOC114580657 n=1 Tax=Dendrobium catenatum TaxID=906689 RepID=UPI00109FF372|nr:uncharacterized protein LOC114580657 [Dendrobium catenatum]
MDRQPNRRTGRSAAAAAAASARNAAAAPTRRLGLDRARAWAVCACGCVAAPAGPACVLGQLRCCAATGWPAGRPSVGSCAAVLPAQRSASLKWLRKCRNESGTSKNVARRTPKTSNFDLSPGVKNGTRTDWAAEPAGPAGRPPRLNAAAHAPPAAKPAPAIGLCPRPRLRAPAPGLGAPAAGLTRPAFAARLCAGPAPLAVPAAGWPAGSAFRGARAPAVAAQRSESA